MNPALATGQRRSNALPIILSLGNAPQNRESELLGRLSPKTKYSFSSRFVLRFGSVFFAISAEMKDSDTTSPFIKILLFLISPVSPGRPTILFMNGDVVSES